MLMSQSLLGGKTSESTKFCGETFKNIKKYFENITNAIFLISYITKRFETSTKLKQFNLSMFTMFQNVLSFENLLSKFY